MNVGSVRKTAITTRVMELIHQVRGCKDSGGQAMRGRSEFVRLFPSHAPAPSLDLTQVVKKGIHITKRDLFYTDVNLFKDQRDVRFGDVC